MVFSRQHNCKKIIFYVSIAIISIFAILTLAYLLPTKWIYWTEKDCRYQVCIQDTDIHTNIIVPVVNDIFDWGNYLDLKEIGTDSLDNYQYLSFGWGDREFMMQVPTLADLDLFLTWKALFIPTPSALSVQGYAQIPENIQKKCILVNRKEYFNLINFLQNTFQVNYKNQPIRIGNGHVSNAGFYDAKGSYSLLRTCNNWTAEGLKKADINTPIWSGLSSAIMRHLKSNCTL